MQKQGPIKKNSLFKINISHNLFICLEVTSKQILKVLLNYEIEYFQSKQLI